MILRSHRHLALWILLLALLSGCGTPSTGQVNQPTTEPTATTEPAATTEPTATTEPAATTEPGTTPEAIEDWYLWPATLNGREVNAAQSSADEAGFELTLDDPANPQNYVWITGSHEPVTPPAGAGEPISVRGVDGTAFTTGGGWTVFWQENNAWYRLGGAMLSAEAARELAETLEPLDLAAWQQKLMASSDSGATPEPAGDCPLPAGEDFHVNFAPFCVAWQDTFDDEQGYRIDISYNPQESFSYTVPADAEQFHVPYEATPRHDEGSEMCLRRSTFSVTLFVLRNDIAEVRDGMAMHSECGMNVSPEPRVAQNLVYAHTAMDEIEGVVEPQGSVSITTLDGGEPRQLASFPAGCTGTGVAVSPDSRHIAYAFGWCATPELRVISSDGSNDRLLLPDQVSLGKQAFSPDGSRLAFVRSRDAGDAPVPQTSIWTLDLASGDAQQITEWSFFYEPAAWISEEQLIYAKAAIGTPPSDWTTYLVDSQPNATPQPLADGRLMEVAPDRSAVVLEFETEPEDDWASRLGIIELASDQLRMLEQTYSFPRVGWAPDSSAIVVAHWFLGLQTVDRATLQAAVVQEASQGADADISEIMWLDSDTAVQVMSGLGDSGIERVSLSDGSTEPLVYTGTGPVTVALMP